jgi:hypothetical protein
MSGPKPFALAACMTALAACTTMLFACQDTTLPPQGQPCIEGRTRTCGCVDMTQGYQSCRFDGMWSLCICGTTGAAGTVGAGVPDASTANK